MARKKATKKYTLNEFKAWLEGIEEIQPNDWSPDASQWEMIRSKIIAIVPEVIEKKVSVAPKETVRPMPQFPPQGMGLPDAQMGMAAGSSLPAPEMTPAAKAALSGNLPKEMVTTPDGGKGSTPNIDTSDGNYDSSFT